MIHKAGKHNEVADALSRSTNLPTSCSTQHTSDHERIRCAQREDKELQQILNFFDNGTVPEGYSAMKMSQNFIIDSQNILYFVKKSTRYEEDSMKLAVPETMKKEVLEKSHDDSIAGHMGISATSARVQEKYWWTKMFSDIKQYVKSCAICAKMKPRNGVPLVPLKPLEVEDLFDRIQIDHVGPIGKCGRSMNTHVLVITECLSNDCKRLQQRYLTQPPRKRLRCCTRR